MPRAKVNGPIEIDARDLRALLFWASVGVSKSVTGSHREASDYIEDHCIRPGVISRFARKIGYKLSYRPIFREPAGGGAS